MRGAGVIRYDELTRRETSLLLAGGALLTSAGCSARSASYRVRMTVEVNTLQGIRTGSSVMEVRATRGMAIGDSSGVSAVLHGEAIVINLPDGPLFVLLKLPDAGPSLAGVISDALLHRSIDTPDAVMSSTAKLGSTWFGSYKADLPRRRDIGASLREDGRDDSNWPIMVRFEDLKDPKSVKVVIPENVGVIKVSLETTHDGVSDSIIKVLPWLGSHPIFFTPKRDSTGGLLPPDQVTIAHLLQTRDFSTRIDDE